MVDYDAEDDVYDEIIADEDDNLQAESISLAKSIPPINIGQISAQINVKCKVVHFVHTCLKTSTFVIEIVMELMCDLHTNVLADHHSLQISAKYDHCQTSSQFTGSVP